MPRGVYPPGLNAVEFLSSPQGETGLSAQPERPLWQKALNPKIDWAKLLEMLQQGYGSLAASGSESMRQAKGLGDLRPILYGPAPLEGKDIDLDKYYSEQASRMPLVPEPSGNRLADLGQLAMNATLHSGSIGTGPKWMRTPKAAPGRLDVTQHMLNAAKGGDETARAAIVDALQDMIAKSANRYTKKGMPTMDVEDLIAEGNHAVLQVLNKGKVTDDLRDFIPYVKGAIEHRIANYERAQTKTRKIGTPMGDEPMLGVEDIASRVPDVPRKEMNSILNHAMGKLTDKQRQVVEMRLGLTESLPEGASPNKIADILDINLSAVQVHLKKGYEKIKGDLKAAGIEPRDLVPDTAMPPTDLRKKPVEGMGAAGKPPISGGSDVPLPSDPKGLIEKLGLRYDGATPGLKPGDPEMHWFTDPKTMSTGLVSSADEWDELISRFQPPIGGGAPTGKRPASRAELGHILDDTVGRLRAPMKEPDPEVIRQIGSSMEHRVPESDPELRLAKYRAGYKEYHYGGSPEETPVPLVSTSPMDVRDHAGAPMMQIKGEAYGVPPSSLQDVLDRLRQRAISGTLE